MSTYRPGQNLSKTRTFSCTQCGTVKAWRYNSKNLFCGNSCRGLAERGKKLSAEQIELMRQNGHRQANDPAWMAAVSRSWFKPGTNSGRRFQKGEPSPRRGTKLTDSHLANVTAANRAKAWKTAGERCHFWKGGVTPDMRAERIKFCNTIRREVMARDNYTCQDCGDRSTYLHVDHVKDWAEFPDQRFQVDNCRTLCRPCHYLKTYGRQMPPESKWGIQSSIRTRDLHHVKISI